MSRLTAIRISGFSIFLHEEDPKASTYLEIQKLHLCQKIRIVAVINFDPPLDEWG